MKHRAKLGWMLKETFEKAYILNFARNVAVPVRDGFIKIKIEEYQSIMAEFNEDIEDERRPEIDGNDRSVDI
jgi:hypothetical protein